MTTRTIDLNQPTAARLRPMNWARVQAASGLVFFVFTALHLLNTALAALGPAVYNAFQRTLRPIYQWPALEFALILAPLAVHVVASVMRMRARKSRGIEASARTRVHRYAGYFLLVVVAGHITATRLPALLRGAFPEFEGVAFTLQFLPGYFFPYYIALALAGLLHASIGLPLALGALKLRVPARMTRGPRFWWPVSLMAVSLLLGMAGFGGLLAEVPDQTAHPFAQVVLEIWNAVFATDTAQAAP